MTWTSALRAPLETDLSVFVHELMQLRIGHRVTEDSGEQVLWVANELDADQVRQLYRLFEQG